jgi:glycogen operon protein
LVNLFNLHDGEVDFTVPNLGDGSAWTAEIDTANVNGDQRSVDGGEAIRMAPRSLLLLR